MLPWRPRILDPRDQDEALFLRGLRATCRVYDTWEAQAAELERTAALRSREPGAGPPPTAGERWVYYPWRRALVRLLDPESFWLLRTDRNRDKITAEEQARLRGLTVGVVGLSVGHAVAHALAHGGLCGRLKLADFDALELSNLNRVPGTVFDLGVNKAVLCARRVAELDPYLPVEIFPEGLSAENTDAFLDGVHILVEECDSIQVKVSAREAARARGIPVVMETSDRGMLDVERFDQEPDRPVLHGLLEGLSAEQIGAMSREELMPVIGRVVEADKGSARMKLSLPRIGETLTTWPQQAHEILLGAALVSAVIQRIGLDMPVASGRTRVDLAEALEGLG